MKIGIAGIGGIGSNVARILAQARVKHIKIVDFDCVEKSNLNRQFYTTTQVGQKKTDSLKVNLLEIFPDMVIETIEQEIDPEGCRELFSDCGLVVEGFDDKKLKKMIVETLADQDINIISASGIAGQNMDRVGVRKIGQCHIVGDFCSDQADQPIFSPKIAMIAAMMAKLVLTCITDHTKPLNAGEHQEEATDE